MYHQPPLGPPPTWNASVHKGKHLETLWNMLAEFEATVEFGEACPLDRYRIIKPFQFNCVVEEPEVPYFNGSELQVNGRPVIATQAPMESTIWDFAFIVLKRGIKTIVTLGNPHEGNKVKMFPYWNSTGTYKKDPYSPITVTPSAASKMINGVVTRTIEFSSSASTATVEHIHFMNWLDHQVPLPSEFYHCIKLFTEREGPSIVHCSAGVGRTGTFLSAVICLNELGSFRQMNSSTPEEKEDKETLANKLCFNATTFMKTRRFLSVECREQFEFLRDFVYQRI